MNDSSHVTLRPGRRQDRAALEAILLEATAALGYSAAMMARVRALVSADPAISYATLDAGGVVVADIDAVAAGFSSVDRKVVHGRAELTGLFVRPEHWRRGIATSLVGAAAALARADGAEALWTVGDSAFYERTGWRAMRKMATPLGRPAWVLELGIAENPCSWPSAS